MSMDIEKNGGAIPRLLDDFVINYGGGCCLYNSDCLDILRTLPDGSVDMILQDPPYNMTACKWECELDFPVLWTEWERVIKENGAIVMTASQPFTSRVVSSNYRLFKYEWIWDKVQPSGQMTAKIMPMKVHENVLVFYKKPPTYNRQFTERKAEDLRIHAVRNKNNQTNKVAHAHLGGADNKYAEDYDPFKVNPKTIISYSKQPDREAFDHPTQKPVDLFRYLIRTYTNEGETVFDGYGGSGTTAIACIKENRKYIVCEKEAEYIEVTKKRIDEATRQGDLFLAAGCCPHDL